MNRKGSILMISLWILAILGIFAIGLGHRASINLKLVRYQRDRLKAYLLAKAGINAIILEKQNDTLPSVDTFNESWSNKTIIDGRPVFKDFSLGDGMFTINYAYRESKSTDKETVLYGMMDEQSKFNINNIIDDIDPVRKKLNQFIGLLKLTTTSGNEDDAENLANALADWIDSDDISRFSGGSEINDYAGLGYVPPNKPLSAIEELLLVKGFIPDIVCGKDKNNDGVIDPTEEGLINYITVYGNGKINVNTTTQEVLQALINVEPQDPEYKYKDLAAEIFIRLKREGNDGIFGTPDDNKDINGIGYIANLFSYDIDKQNMISRLSPYLAFNSNTFRIKSTGIVNSIKRETEAVVNLELNKPPTFLYWHQN